MNKYRIKILKITIGIASGLILTGLIVFAILYFVAQSYLNKNLSDMVEKKTKGKYEITYDNLKFSYKSWGIEINQLSYHPSDSVINALKNNTINKQFYSFSSPQVRISGIKLLQLVLEKKLEVGELIIDQPEFKIHGRASDNENKQDGINALIQDLKPLVTKRFKSVSFGKIELRNASYDFYNLMGDTKKLSNAENISIGVLKFYTDSTALLNPARLFDAADIYVKMQKYQTRLADSIHSIRAERVTYSFKRSVIEAQNIELKPVNQMHPEKSRYYFLIPQARLTTQSVRKIYRDKLIPIDSLVLKNAIIKYWPGIKQGGSVSDAEEEFDLNDLIKNDISGVTVHDLALEHAHLQLFKSQLDTAFQQELKNISLKLNDFKLDTTSQNDTSRVFYSKKIEFSASDYNLTLGDNRHCVRAAKLSLSTKDHSVQVKEIEVYPRNNDSKTYTNYIEARCDSIRLDDFDFKKAFHQKRFAFQHINVFNPKVKLTQNVLRNENKAQTDSSFVYSLISRYVKGVYASQVVVSRGEMQLINKTGVLQTGNIESAIRLQLGGFALDEFSIKRTDRLFYANQIELNFSNYQMQLRDQLHKMTIENLSISTRKKRAELQNLHLFPVSKENAEELLKQYNRSELYEFTIPELSLSDADFHNAFFNKKFTIDSLRIVSPQIYYESYAQLKQLKQKQDFDDLFRLISDYLIDIQVNSVEIPEGTLRLVNHSLKDKVLQFDNRFSLKLGNTRINEDNFNQKHLLLSDYVDFSMRDHLIRLSDNVHVLKAGEIGFSTRKKEIYVLNARLYPETNSKDFSSVRWNIQLSLPEIRIKGISIEDFFFDHKINADNLIITSPDIKFYQKTKPDQKKDIKEVLIPLPREIESIMLQNFSLKDGALKVFSELETKPVLLVQSDIKMSAKNILIVKTSATANPEFKSGDYTGSLLQFRFTPKDKNQKFSIDELNFSTAERKITAKNLLVGPKTKSARENQFTLQVPTLSMSGFDMGNAYKNKIFSFGAIVIDKPVFQRFSTAKDTLRTDPFKLNFYPYFESFADGFLSQVLTVNNAAITIFQAGQKKFQETVSLNLVKVKIDNKPSQGFMHSADFSMTIPNLKRPGRLYRFDADKVSYSSVSNAFSISGIKIVPNFSKEVHQTKVGFQSDYYSGKIDSVCIAKPDIRRWFAKDELAGKSLGIYGLTLDIYRDKKSPFDESRRPKMLQDLIKSIKTPVTLDSLFLARSEVKYTEKTASGNREGTIRFTHIRAGLLPFTNLKSSAGRLPDFKLNGHFVVQDSTQVKVAMNYQMNDAANSFTVRGNASPFNMHILNSALEPLALISIRSGRVNRFDFDFSADRNSASGELFLGYDNLKIGVLEMKDGTARESHFTSFLANSLLLRGKNPRGKEFLPDEISFKRDEKRSVVQYWWKSVFSGVKTTLGIKDNKPEEPGQSK